MLLKTLKIIFFPLRKYAISKISRYSSEHINENVLREKTKLPNFIHDPLYPLFCLGRYEFGACSPRWIWRYGCVKRHWFQCLWYQSWPGTPLHHQNCYWHWEAYRSPQCPRMGESLPSSCVTLPAIASRASRPKNPHSTPGLLKSVTDLSHCHLHQAHLIECLGKASHWIRWKRELLIPMKTSPWCGDCIV